VTFFSDFAAGSVHATLNPLSTTSTPFPSDRKAVNTTTSTTNPSFWLSWLLFGYNPTDGSIGDASSFEVTFRNASQLGMLSPPPCTQRPEQAEAVNRTS
jgi:hypothetical protein